MSFFRNIKDYFFNGLLLILPLFFTLSILKMIINLLSKWLLPIHNILPTILTKIIYIEILIGVSFIISFGYIVKRFLLHKFFESLEEIIFKKIPIFESIYFGIKKITNLVNNKNNLKNKEDLVAWIHLPYKNIYCLGLMTGKLDSHLAPDQNKIYFCFFVPHTPNPISGYYVIAAEGDFVTTNLTRQEAMSMIMSGGIIRPENK
jgi:uncharacterized membrane protein